MPIVQGKIVVANVLDPQSGNPKDRPLVVIMPTAEIAPNKPLGCVAITKEISPLTPDLVELPFHDQGHCGTRLKYRSAAKCDWLVTIQHDEILMELGNVPSGKLTQILDYVAAAGNS